MTSLEARKRLLVAEAEMQRNLLRLDLLQLRGGVGAVADQAQSVGAWALAANSLMSSLGAFRREQSGNGHGKPSFLQSLLSAGRLGMNVWGILQSVSGDTNPKKGGQPASPSGTLLGLLARSSAPR
jgi:hypothetical protein